MQVIPLQRIPRQTVSFTYNRVPYTITLLAIQNCMYATVSIKNTIIVKGIRCVAGFRIMPYKYMELGNFAFVTDSEELPWWEKFGINQTLVFASDEEIAALRA